MPEPRILDVIPDIKVADGVAVFTESIYVHRSGHRDHHVVGAATVSPDVAGDLADQPIAWVVPVTSDLMGVAWWEVGAVGFIEQEAAEALEAAVSHLAAQGPKESNDGR